MCFSTSLFVFYPQDENSSVCNQKVDILQKTLLKEQQELQVSITITVTYPLFSIVMPFFFIGDGNSEVICTFYCS